MKKPVVALDCDDVLVDFNRHFIAFMQERYGSTVTYETAYTFDLTKLYGCTEAEMTRRLQEFFDSHHHHTIEVVEGAVEALRQLGTSHELHVVTSRHAQVQTQTTRLLRRCFEHRTFTRVHFTVAHDGTKRSKAEVCTEIGALFLVEDALHHAEGVARDAKIPVYMPDVPWNRDYDPVGVKRIYGGWPEILNTVLERA